jgi:hypothetical protein
MRKAAEERVLNAGQPDRTDAADFYERYGT